MDSPGFCGGRKYYVAKTCDFLFPEKSQILEHALATHSLVSLISIFCILLCVVLGLSMQEKWVEYSFIND
jgi:ABC-type proline/glycine betaine transport system permease subunit